MKPDLILIIFSTVVLTLRYVATKLFVLINVEHFSATAVAKSVHDLPSLDRFAVSIKIISI